MVALDKDLEALTPKELAAYYDEALKAAKKRKPLKPKRPATAEEEEEEEEEDDDDDEDDEGDEDEEDEDEAPDAEPEPLDLEDAYLRVRRISTFPGSEGNLVLTPGGDRYVFTGSYGESGLYSLKWDGTDRKKLAGNVNVQHVTLTGDKVVFVSGGRAGTVAPSGGKVEYVDLDHSIRIDLQEQSSQKFLEAARVLGEQFYHPDMKGLDWPNLTDRYHGLARQARTANEFNHVGAYFLGELAASHLGIRASAPSSPNRQSRGRLGIRTERVADGYRVTYVVPEGPAAKGSMALLVGDVITGVETGSFENGETLESRLEGRVGEETLVDVRRTLEDGRDVDVQVLITPISYSWHSALLYRAWRTRNADLVHEWSDGRIGYIHIQGMNQPSLDVFERDLFAACDGKDGLIIDVRNNGGGWTTDRLLSSIMVRPHAYTIPRGADPDDTGHYPQDRLFIQRYTLPINALCNEKSFSNAEIFSHAFKALERGTLVGQETWGGVISTGGFSLIDGTFVRLPFRGWYLNDGTDMENHGAVPDIIVPQTPEAEAGGEDEQLRTAVEDLLGRLD
jgi:tricorn protease